MNTPPRKKLFDLVGEGHKNADGSSRQAILKQAVPGEQIILVRQQDNPHDSNAILALVECSGGVGMLSRADAAIVAPLLDSGLNQCAYIHELTGGLPEYENFGCVISVVWEGWKKPAPRPLRPEQEYYEHAPTGLVQSDKSKGLLAKKPPNGLLMSIIRSIFK